MSASEAAGALAAERESLARARERMELERELAAARETISEMRYQLFIQNELASNAVSAPLTAATHTPTGLCAHQSCHLLQTQQVLERAL